jgi:hypothetical protein
LIFEDFEAAWHPPVNGQNTHPEQAAIPSLQPEIMQKDLFSMEGQRDQNIRRTAISLNNNQEGPHEKTLFH